MLLAVCGEPLGPFGLIHPGLRFTDESCGFLRRYDRNHLELKVVAECVGDLSYRFGAVGLEDAKGMPLIDCDVQRLHVDTVEAVAIC